MTQRFFAAVIVFMLYAMACRAEEIVHVLDDFDEDMKLSQRWTALGPINARRTLVAKDATIPGVSGHLVVCDARPDSRFLVQSTFPRPDYEKYDTVRFQFLAQNASQDQPLDFEFRVFSQHRKAWMWRKFSARSNQWQTVELPMHFFRFSRGASVDWNEVSRFGFHFRDACRVKIDRIELVAHDADASPYLSAEELGELAFGPDATYFGDEHFVLITNDERVDGNAVLDEFNKLFAMIYADFPRLRRPARPIPTLIFDRKATYQAFWPRLGHQFESIVPPVRSSGYSLLGVAGSYHSDEFGPVRPVLIHEACHALLGPVLGLSNTSEWLHEGLANYYQLNWTQQDVHRLTRAQIQARKHKPLRELLDGQPVQIRDYAQVTLFVKWLMSDAQRKEHLMLAIRDMRQRTSTDLEPICERHFGRPLDELELDWLRWATQQK